MLEDATDILGARFDRRYSGMIYIRLCVDQRYSILDDLKSVRKVQFGADSKVAAQRW